MHNSNHKTQQTTLEGEIVQEYTYYVLGFVPADVVRLKKDVWFSKLDSEQISSVELPRTKIGKRQTVNTLINEKVILRAEYLRDKRKAWVTRFVVV